MTNLERRVDRFLVWNPGVHHLYGEDLHFFLIRARFFGADFRQWVETTLQACGIRGYCIYQVFGDYDVLVRAWLTRAKHERFQTRLDENPQISNVAEFRSNEIRYLWANRAVTRTQEEEQKRIGQAVLDHGGRAKLTTFQANPDADPGLLVKLKESRLLLDYRGADVGSPRQPVGVKFFCFFDVAAAIDLTSVGGELQKYISEQAVAITMPSLYLGMGTGCGPLLLKGIAPDVYGVSDIVLRLLRGWPYIGLVSKTYIVCAPDWKESDEVDFSLTRDPEILGRYQYVLRVDPSVLDSLDPITRQRFESKFEELSSTGVFDEQPDYSLLRAAFTALAYNSPRVLQHELYSIIEIEAALRDYMARFLFDRHGEDWPRNSLPDLAKKAEVEPPDKSPSRYTMHEAVKVLGVANSIANHIVSDAFGDRWEETLKELGQLRNDWAHGRVTGKLLEAGNWEHLVDLLLRASKLQAKLLEEIARLTPEKKR